MSDSEHLTEREAQEIARVSRWTLWRYRKQRKVPYLVLPGGRVLYPKKRFLDWLRSLEKN